MAIKKKVQGKAPEKAEKSSAKAADTKTSKAGLLGTAATVKLTVSVKRRLGNGDEVFFAPGMELHVAPEDFSAAKEQVTNTLEAWVAELTEKFPDPADAEDDADDADDSDDDDDAEDDADDDEDGLTEDDVKGMAKKELLALIKEQELEIDGAAKMGVKELRDAVVEALFSDDDDDSDDDDADDDDDSDDDDSDDDSDDDADDDDDDDDDDDSDDDGDDDLYTEAELKGMKLAELQEIVDEWKIKHPKYAKDAKSKDKIGIYVKHILKHQEA